MMTLMKLKDLPLGTIANYSGIAKLTDFEEYEMHEFEISTAIGRSIMMFDHMERDETITFMLDGATNNGFLYKLIYKA